MKKTADVVIGANFGDEGKGLITDYLASQYDECLVVRFNGGAQAGHTVCDPIGTRFIFSHLGSGSLLGHATYLMESFIVNPALFVREFKNLPIKGTVYINPNAMVTTPFDMLLNQEVEKARNEWKHGSCGVGINETVVRDSVYPLCVGDLFDVDQLRKKLLLIRRKYVHYRLSQIEFYCHKTKMIKYGFNLLEESEFLKNTLTDDNVIDNFIADCQFLIQNSILMRENKAVALFDHFVFEGAQGLLLDQNNKLFFPHVTRSNTGLTNIKHLIGSGLFDTENIYYVTRWYVTRHGAGGIFDLVEEKEDLSPLIEDKTNITNDYQGNLRYGVLDVNCLRNSICCDLKNLNMVGSSKIANIALTCLDQVECQKGIPIIDDNGNKVHVSIPYLLNLINPTLTSYGPTRKDVTNYKNGPHSRN